MTTDVNAITRIAIEAVEHSKAGDVEQAYSIAVGAIMKEYPFELRDVAFTACLTFIAGIAVGKHIERLRRQ